MSEKNRLKKDGSDKNKENQARREAEAYPDVKRALSAEQLKGHIPTGKGAVLDRKHKDRN